MGKYSIKDLEKLSGIKAHTLRIWEKRYTIIDPHRTDTNIRYYTDDDLKKILNISILNNNGIRISKLAELSDKDLSEKVMEFARTEDNADVHVDRLIISMIDLDELLFEKVLSDIIIRFGFEEAVTTTLYKFLEKIGILWITGNINPAHEHFITALIRQKMLVAIDALPVNTADDAQKVVLFLPENELHEIGLLFYQYLFKKNGYKTIYLGQSVPFEDLEAIDEVHNPDLYFGAIVTNPLQVELQDYVDQICTRFNNRKIFFTGGALLNAELQYPENATVIKEAPELKPILFK